MNCRPNHKGPWPICDKCLQQPQPVSCGDTETKMCPSRDRTPQCFWCLIIIFPERLPWISQNVKVSFPQCVDNPKYQLVGYASHYPTTVCGFVRKVPWVPSNLNSSFPDSVNRQFRGIPPVLDTPIYPKMSYCCLRISQKFLTPDSMIIMYYIYITILRISQNTWLPDNNIIYIPSFVDHFSLFGWFNSLFVSKKFSTFRNFQSSGRSDPGRMGALLLPGTSGWSCLWRQRQAWFFWTDWILDEGWWNPWGWMDHGTTLW